MEPDVVRRGVENISHLSLAEPDGFAFETDFGLTVPMPINYDLAQGVLSLHLVPPVLASLLQRCYQLAETDGLHR